MSFAHFYCETNGVLKIRNSACDLCDMSRNTEKVKIGKLLYQIIPEKFISICYNNLLWVLR